MDNAAPHHSVTTPSSPRPSAHSPTLRSATAPVTAKPMSPSPLVQTHRQSATHPHDYNTSTNIDEYTTDSYTTDEYSDDYTDNCTDDCTDDCTDNYTDDYTDDYTDNCTDNYTDDNHNKDSSPVFSDSNYDSDEASQNGKPHTYAAGAGCRAAHTPISPRNTGSRGSMAFDGDAMPQIPLRPNGIHRTWSSRSSSERPMRDARVSAAKDRKRRSLMLLQNDSVPGLESANAALGSVLGSVSSGRTSPQPDANAAMRISRAIGHAHRFESHTPWAISSGRLTNERQKKDRLWDRPDDVAEAGAAGVAEAGLADYADLAHAQHHAAGYAPQPSHIAPSALASQPAAAAPMQYARQQQVVNVVPVQQGTKPYAQLQQHAVHAQRLHQDIDKRQPRIVTIAQFLRSVTRLLRIGFPGVTSTESRLALSLVAVLGARTGLDVWFSSFNARVVHSVVTYNRDTLIRRLLPEYLAMMVPMAAINQSIKWLINSLTTALRVRLGRYAHERYVDGVTSMSWARATGKPSGPQDQTPGFERADWLLAVQIHRFADMFPRLIADMVKPTIDWFVFSQLLSRFIGRSGSLKMVLYVVMANVVIRALSPPQGATASMLAQLEEKYRAICARISTIIQSATATSAAQLAQRSASCVPSPISNGDESDKAFVPRVQEEFRAKARKALDGSLDGVAKALVRVNMRRFFGGIGETILAKYGATLVAYYLLAKPLCSPGRRLASEILHDPAAVMTSYSRNSAYLINLSQATTRLLLMLNDLPKFAWSAVKVDGLLRSLDVHSKYRSMP